MGISIAHKRRKARLRQNAEAPSDSATTEADREFAVKRAASNFVPLKTRGRAVWFVSHGGFITTPRSGGPIANWF